MNELSTEVFDIKQRLDEIDRQAVESGKDQLIAFRMGISGAMWEKGRAVEKWMLTPGLSSATYYNLQKITGRNHSHLKRWHKLYLKFPDKTIYLEKVKPKVERVVRDVMRRLITMSEQNKKPELPYKDYGHFILNFLLPLRTNNTTEFKKAIDGAISEVLQNGGGEIKGCQATLNNFQVADITIKFVRTKPDIRG